MSGASRKRKSQWDSKEDDQPPNVNEKNSYHEKDTYSSLHVGRESKWAEADNELVSKDARWSSVGPPLGSSYRDDGRDFNDLPPTRRGLDGDKRYHVSPSFDGQRRQNNSRSPPNNLNHSRRFRRSRSRSHSRSRSDSRGRGRSRSRERSRDQIRGRSRDRARVRGRSRSRSRSPLGDYRREPHGYNDRRSGSGLSSQPCRDFAAGDCRRGSQCRFLHQKDLSDRDGGRSETNQSERWRSKQEQGGNYYDGEKDESSKSSYKSTTVCNDFQKGRCSRGSQCRFLHDDGFGDRIERSSRNMPFEHNYKQHSHRSDIVPCKFFMMGKCQRDNCRFSHAAPVRDDRDDRRGPDTDDINKTWNGPKWEEALAISGNVKSTGWDGFGKGPSSYPTSERHDGDRWDHSSGDMNNQFYGPKRGDDAIVLDSSRSAGWANDDVENLKSTNSVNTEKSSENRWDRHSNDESAVYGDLSWKNKAAEGNESISPHMGAGGTANEVIAGSVNMEKSFDAKELTLTSHEENKMQETSNQLPAPPVMHGVFPDYSQFQQHPNEMGGNNVIADYSSSANGVHRYGNVSYPALAPVQSGNQNSNSFGTQASGFGGINQSQGTTFGNPSNIPGNNSYEPVQQHFSASDLQNQNPMKHDESSGATMAPGMPQKTVNGEQVSPLANISESLKQIHEKLPQLYAVLNPPSSVEVAHPVPNSAGLLLSFTPTTAQAVPAAMVQKQYDPIGDSIEPHKLGNHSQPPLVSSNSEHVNEVALEQSAPSSAVALSAGKLHNSALPGDNNNNEKVPEPGKDKPVTKSVLEADTEGPAETHKQEQQTTSVKKLDAEAKTGDGTNGKDDKTMRQFKVALVEFVKEILKPKWKEGHMSRDVHKTIVKKVVDKVTSTIQGASIPKTQEKIDQYLAYSKPKLSKLVEAYTERFSKSS